MTTPLRLVFEVAIGADTKNVAVELTRLSRLLNIDLFAKVNGVEMYARPGDSTLFVWNRWNAQLERRARLD